MFGNSTKMKMSRSRGWCCKKNYKSNGLIIFPFSVAQETVQKLDASGNRQFFTPSSQCSKNLWQKWLLWKKLGCWLYKNDKSKSYTDNLALFCGVGTGAKTGQERKHMAFLFAINSINYHISWAFLLVEDMTNFGSTSFLKVYPGYNNDVFSSKLRLPYPDLVFCLTIGNELINY